MFLFAIALAQDCSVSSAVALYPLGDVPSDAVHRAVVRTDCTGEVHAEVTVYDEERIVARPPAVVAREDAFAFMEFEIGSVPTQVELFVDIEVQVDGRTVLFLGGWFQVDPQRTERLDGLPELGDLRVERTRTGDAVQIEASAAVLPATTAPEAFLLWRADGVLRDVSVSTQPRPLLTWQAPAPADVVCIEVEEIGVDGDRVLSEARCDEPARTGCGCSALRASAPWWMFVAGRRRG